MGWQLQCEPGGGLDGVRVAAYRVASRGTRRPLTRAPLPPASPPFCASTAGGRGWSSWPRAAAGGRQGAAARRLARAGLLPEPAAGAPLLRTGLGWLPGLHLWACLAKQAASCTISKRLDTRATLLRLSSPPQAGGQGAGGRPRGARGRGGHGLALQAGQRVVQPRGPPRGQQGARAGLVGRAGALSAASPSCTHFDGRCAGCAAHALSLALPWFDHAFHGLTQPSSAAGHAPLLPYNSVLKRVPACQRIQPVPLSPPPPHRSCTASTSTRCSSA